MVWLGVLLGPVHTGRGTRRTTGHKQMGPVDVNRETLHTSNIKGKTFEFAPASCPASCVDWALGKTKQDWANLCVPVPYGFLRTSTLCGSLRRSCVCSTSGIATDVSCQIFQEIKCVHLQSMTAIPDNREIKKKMEIKFFQQKIIACGWVLVKSLSL